MLASPSEIDRPALTAETRALLIELIGVVQQATETRQALTPAEAAAMLGVSRQTVYNLIDRKKLSRYKVGNRTRIPTVEVLALIGGGPAASPPAA